MLVMVILQSLLL